MPRIRKPTTAAVAALLLAPALAAAQFRARDGTPIVRDPSVPGTLDLAPPPPPGPAPQGIRFESSATYGIFAKIAWNPAPNATRYMVSRGKRDDAICCNATSGDLPANTTSWADVGLFKPGYYRYTITVNYADGSVGKGEIDLVLQHGASPTVRVQDLGLGRVRLEWHHGVVPGTCCVKIVGPGLGPTGEKMVPGGGPLDLPILPAGTHTWKVAAAYDAANLPVQPATNYGTATMQYTVYGTTTKTSSTYVVLAPPSEWAEVSHTVSYGSGRYRISLEGFKAINVTAEDPFRHDGRGDEVFITTQVSEYWRNGSLVSTRMVRTPTFGDMHNFPARVQAGSASPQGGIMPNDRYPAEAQLISQLQPATTSNLPYLLWEGELTEIDNAVILSPAIWESDEGDELFPSFANFHTRAAPGVGYLDKLHPYVPNTYGRPILDTWNPQRSCPRPLGSDSPPTLFVPAINGWRDEPMDMNPDHSYCPTYVAINWKIARDMTTVNPATVVEIPFRNGHTNWEYKLYIRVEKVAPAPQAVPVIAPRSTRRAAGP
jgi:hypothetical protein